MPAGHGDGAGLPVCLILHGGSKRPADFAGLGLGRFLTDAVNRGAPPFVLAGATGDRLAWQPGDEDDPQRMLVEELPAWCAARGFDAGRPAAGTSGPGGHDFAYWSTAVPAAFAFLAAELRGPVPETVLSARDEMPVCGTAHIECPGGGESQERSRVRRAAALVGTGGRAERGGPSTILRGHRTLSLARFKKMPIGHPGTEAPHDMTRPRRVGR
ncbi:hypothetical protein ACFOZ6_19620 [Actinoplanes siamensis]